MDVVALETIGRIGHSTNNRIQVNLSNKIREEMLALSAPLAKTMVLNPGSGVIKPGIDKNRRSS